jgi:hypothetical protein
MFGLFKKKKVYLKTNLVFVSMDIDPIVYDVMTEAERLNALVTYNGRILLQGNAEIERYYEFEPGVVNVIAKSGQYKIVSSLEMFDKKLLALGNTEIR